MALAAVLCGGRRIDAGESFRGCGRAQHNICADQHRQRCGELNAGPAGGVEFSKFGHGTGHYGNWSCGFDVRNLGKVQQECAKHLTFRRNRFRMDASAYRRIPLACQFVSIMPAISSHKPYRIGRSRTGLGLFATKPIKKGARIVRYFGPLLDSRNKKHDDIENKYLFELNGRWTIDGSVRKNVARYINHACRPNAESDVSARKRKVVIRAIKNIEPGEEINYDYGTDYFKAYLKPIGCKCASCEKKRKKLRAEEREKKKRAKARAEKKAAKAKAALNGHAANGKLMNGHGRTTRAAKKMTATKSEIFATAKSSNKSPRVSA
jgi:hypothetical protein